jgi:Dockerin type I domain
MRKIAVSWGDAGLLQLALYCLVTRKSNTTMSYEKSPCQFLIPCSLPALICSLCAVALSSPALAVPYASGLSESGGTVTYVLNEDADSITVKRTGDTDLVLAGSDLLKGTHTFAKGSATGYQIEVSKSTPVGWFQTNDPTTEITSKYFSPRGVTINQNPSSPYFGNIYVSEAIPGTTGGDPNTTVIRTTLAPGIFAITADGTDVYGIGDIGRDGGLFVDFAGSNTNTPFKLAVAPDDSIYISGWGDAAPGVWRAPADLSGSSWPNVLANNSCDSTGLCSNHGSIPSVYVEGTGAGTQLFTMDEDWPDSSGLNAAGRGDIHRYDIGTSTNVTDAPIVVVDDGGDGSISGKILNGQMDFVRDSDGSWWIAQFRADDSYSVPALSHWADDPNGGAPLWNSGKADREPGDFDWDTDVDGTDFLIWQRNFPNNSGSATPFQGDANGDGIVDPNDLAIWEANYEDVTQLGLLVLQGGFGALDIKNDQDLLVMATRFGEGIYIIDISNPNAPVLQATIVHGGTTINDVAFDIAGNVYAVSRSTETLKIYSPGGDFVATTGSDGSFSLLPGALAAGTAVPEPSTLLSWLALSVITLVYRPCRQPVKDFPG